MGNNECPMEDRGAEITMKGMERQALHYTAFNVIYHREIVKNDYLVDAAINYLKRILDSE